MGLRQTPGWRSQQIHTLLSSMKGFQGYLSRTRRWRGSGLTRTQARTLSPQGEAIIRRKSLEGRLTQAKTLSLQGGATMRRKSLKGKLHDCLRNRDSGGNQEETMGDGLDSLVRGETQVIKMARGYFWNNVVLYFINLHLNSD